jgi:hypothetical protein
MDIYMAHLSVRTINQAWPGAPASTDGPTAGRTCVSPPCALAPVAVSGHLARDKRPPHLRYHHQLWQDLKPKTLQGVNTTLIVGLPQIGFALAPHIQLEKVFLFLGSLARGLGPVQLFPARYIYPDAQLGGLADVPAPIFADILPATGGFAYPCVDCEPDPWRVLARFGNGDRFYGYPFRAAANSMEDFTLHDHETGAMLLPSGRRVVARHSESCVYATLDPKLKDEMMMDRDGFEGATCLLRGAVTHDGLPFQLPVEL